jgi:hypothetical protein
LPNIIRQEPDTAKAGSAQTPAFQLVVIGYLGFAVSYALSDSTLEMQHIAQYVMSLFRLLINDPDKG